MKKKKLFGALAMTTLAASSMIALGSCNNNQELKNDVSNVLASNVQSDETEKVSLLSSHVVETVNCEGSLEGFVNWHNYLIEKLNAGYDITVKFNETDKLQNSINSIIDAFEHGYFDSAAPNNADYFYGTVFYCEGESFEYYFYYSGNYFTFESDNDTLLAFILEEGKWVLDEVISYYFTFNYPPIYINDSSNIIFDEVSFEFFSVLSAEISLDEPADSDYPEISCGDIVVNVDNPLTLAQIKACFSATDATEGDITSKITWSNITYPSSGNPSVGEYSITATVADAAGNSASLTKTIRVVDITNPTITATNKTTGNSLCLTTVNLKALFTASDNVTASPTITITADNYTANYKKPGSYTVTAKATDAAGNYSTATATITVTDTTKPSITATNKATGNSTCLSQANLLALFTASDDVTTTPTITITADNYTANYKKPGSYTVTAKATDAAGNYSTATATITVTDTTAPTITATNATVNRTYTSKFTTDELKALFTATDDVTTSPTITITADNYTASYNTPGTYTVTAKATDAAGNYSTANVSIKVIDDVKPVITFASQVKITTLDNITLDYLKQYVSVVDAIDGNLTFTLTDTDNYLANTKVPGSYTITITGKDSSNNTATETFELVVEDKDTPSITVSGITIGVSSGDVYTREDIVNFLIQSGQLTQVEAATVSLSSDYFVESTSGNLTKSSYSLQLVLASGEVRNAIIKVSQDEPSNTDETATKWYQKVWDFIKEYKWYFISGVGILVLLGLLFIRKRK